MYVLDTNSIRVFGNYYPDVFPSFWDQLNDLIADNRLVSVREVRKELDVQVSDNHLRQWVEDHSGLFLPPTETEMEAVRDILSIDHFQQMIGERQRLRGMPVADPWLIARAIATDGAVVVTEEEHKPNAARIPNVCEHFNVACTDVQGMLRTEGWRY